VRKVREESVEVSVVQAARVAVCGGGGGSRECRWWKVMVGSVYVVCVAMALRSAHRGSKGEVVAGWVGEVGGGGGR